MMPLRTWHVTDDELARKLSIGGPARHGHAIASERRVDAVARELAAAPRPSAPAAEAERPRARRLRLIAPTQHRQWDASEDERLRQGYARGLSCNAIRATLLPARTAGAIAARAAQFGLGAHGRRWTVADDAELAALGAGGCSLEEAARRLERTPDAVRRRTKQIGVPCPPPERQGARSHLRWSRKEDDLLRRSAGVEIVLLSRRLGRSEEAIRQRLTTLERQKQFAIRSSR